MKTFFAFLLAGLTVLLAIVFCIALTSKANAEELPNPCNSGDVQQDYDCMKLNWRPIKLVSYDTAKKYCNTGNDVLHGKGEIVLYVDDIKYIFKIECP